MMGGWCSFDVISAMNENPLFWGRNKSTTMRSTDCCVERLIPSERFPAIIISTPHESPRRTQDSWESGSGSITRRIPITANGAKHLCPSNYPDKKPTSLEPDPPSVFRSVKSYMVNMKAMPFIMMSWSNSDFVLGKIEWTDECRLASCPFLIQQLCAFVRCLTGDCLPTSKAG